MAFVSTVHCSRFRLYETCGAQRLIAFSVRWRSLKRCRLRPVCELSSDGQLEPRRNPLNKADDSSEGQERSESERSQWTEEARRQWPEYEPGFVPRSRNDLDAEEYPMSTPGDSSGGAGIAAGYVTGSREVIHDPVVVSRRELLYAVISIAIIVTGILGTVYRRSLRWFSLAGVFGSLRRRYPPPNANLREFMMECEAGAGPVAPALQHCYYIQWLGGASSALEAAPGHCTGKKLLVLLLWRATDSGTGAALDVLENLRPYMDFIDIVCMHTPKFDGERPPRFVQLSAKYHEMNFPYGADVSLRLWRDLGVTVWPTAVVLSPRSKRVLFAFEGYRALPRILLCVRAAIDFYFPRRVATQPPPEPSLRSEQLPSGKSARLGAHSDAFPISAGALSELLENRRRALASAEDTASLKEQRSSTRTSKRSSRKRDKASPESRLPTRSPLPPQDVYGRQILALLDTSRQALALRFPGKLDVHAESDRLFIADSGHHRILVTKLSGEFIEQIGGREGAGFRDGTFSEALFQYPQGLVFDPLGNRLIVADSGNNALRIVRFSDGTVSTASVAPLVKETDVQGVMERSISMQDRESGRHRAAVSAAATEPPAASEGTPFWAWQRRWFKPERTRPAVQRQYEQLLSVADADVRFAEVNDRSNNTSSAAKSNSKPGTAHQRTGIAANSSPLSLTPSPRSRFRLPWDVKMHAGSVYVAVAGSHQIWRLDSTGILREYRGSGKPGLVDDAEGSRVPVSFAAPHGVCVQGTCLYVTDSDSSTVRAIDLRAQWTRTIVGGDVFFLESLSTFGDRDGWGRGGHLQYPCGCCALPDGQILLADTLNHKIKVLNLELRDVRTLAGSGEPGLHDGASTQAAFFAPQGIAYDPTVRMAYVADTYNHCIRQVDVATGTVRTLTLTPPAVLEALAAPAAETSPNGR
jgi:DNA-binding beta-propeller fold protein YncE